MSATVDAPLIENEHVQTLLKILLDNDKTRDSQNLKNLLGHVTAMESQLAAAVEELKNIRGELDAMRHDHPLRVRLAALKQSVIDGCKHAAQAFKNHGISALAYLADFFKLRPALEAIGRYADGVIRADDQSIAKIEAVSAGYHETGRQFKNMFRTMAGKDAIIEAKPVGNVAKTLTAPYKTERRVMRGIRKGVDAALSGLSMLEQARPIKEQFADAAREAAAANAVIALPGRGQTVQVDR